MSSDPQPQPPPAGTDTDTIARQHQQQAQALYKEGRFEDALHFLTAALNLDPLPSPNVQLSIYDNRAATLTKLQKITAAIRDSKKMLEVAPAASAGYLRAGKLLLLSGADQTAVDIYKCALLKVDPKDDKFEMVKTMLAKAQKRLEEKARLRPSVDPFEKLPNELIDMVLDNFDFRTVMRLRRVCKSWNEYIRKSERCYRCLDFSRAMNKVSKSVIQRYLTLARGSVRSLVLKNLGFSDCAALTYIIQRTKGLESFHAVDCAFPFDAYVRVAYKCEHLIALRLNNVSFNAMIKILELRPNLQTLMIDNINYDEEHRAVPSFESHGLRALAIIFPLDGINNRGMVRVPSPPVHICSAVQSGLLPRLQALHTLRLTSFTTARRFDIIPDCPNLEVLELYNCSTMPFPGIPASVRQFRLVKTYEPLETPLELLQANPLPNLELLVLDQHRLLENQHILELIKHTTKLHTLHLKSLPKVDLSCLKWLTDGGHSSGIVDLSVYGSNSFGDEVSKQFNKFGKLERIDMGETKVSGIGVVNVLNMAGEDVGGLKWMGLAGCENVGRDAINLVWKRGVRVSWRSAFVDTKGKKVRYGQ